MRPRRVATSAVLVAIGATFLYASTFVFSYSRLWSSRDPLLMTDVARLIPTKVYRIDSHDNVADLQAVLKEARDTHRKVSIAGSRHSQGGHIFYKDSIVLNMRAFKKILNLDREKKILTVQSGATWDEIQQYINPYGLAVKVMQSSYIFTIGGTLSANAHGRDLDKTSVVETVHSFRLLLADGRIVNVSREENPELFKLVIGGYGLFGVILEVDLELTDNEIYERRAEVIDYTKFLARFEELKKDPTVALLLARPSIDPNPESFLKEMTFTTWHKTEQKGDDSLLTLGAEQNVLRDKFFFGLSRKYNWAKSLRWSLQKKIESSPGQTKLIARNNAMRPPETPLEFLDYYSSRDTDIIQEYYVPTRNFVPFMDEFRRILLEGKMNVVSSTVRYVKANDETFLSYAPKEDAFAIIQMSNVGLSEKEQAHAKEVTQQLVGAALRYGGTYYLTYQLYPTPEQLRKAYPRADVVFERKRFYDPEEMFMNTFYEHYALSPTTNETP